MNIITQKHVSTIAAVLIAFSFIGMAVSALLVLAADFFVPEIQQQDEGMVLKVFVVSATLALIGSLLFYLTRKSKLNP